MVIPASPLYMPTDQESSTASIAAFLQGARRLLSRRVTLFAGHYGSGKTNIAIAYAEAKATLQPVAIADLDIVNPYFRTKDSAAELAARGIELVVSEYANSNVDFPALPKDAYRLAADRTKAVVIDVGGDDRGALALGRYAPEIAAEGDYEMLAVVNCSRPLTRTVEATVEVLREIEASASGLRFTGIVNNTNLGAATTAATVLESREYAEAIAAAMGLAVAFTSCTAALYKELAPQIPLLLPMHLQRHPTAG